MALLIFMQTTNKDFISSIFLSLTGKKLEKEQQRILKKCFEEFWQFKDDPIEPPSSQLCLLMASCQQKLPQVLSSTINSFGEAHFCFSKVYLFVTDGDYEGATIPGFGHPKYKNGDPRVQKLIKYCKSIGYKNDYLDQMIYYGKFNKLELNFAGFFSCLLIDCGCNEYNIDLFPILCRMVGLTKIYADAKTKGIEFASGYDVIKKFGRKAQV
jgi:hypothetical protein